jgi:hypothetical protein
MKKYDYRNIYILILIAIIIILSIVFYLFDDKSLQVQEHLKRIHSNGYELKKRYKYFINSEATIKKLDNLIVIEDFLNKDYFQYLQKQFDGKNFESKDFLLRKGSGFNFFNLHENKEYNGFLELFYSTELQETLSNTLKKPIQRPALSDPNACSLLLYSKKGDYIDWHLDFSSYYGDRFVTLFTLINENKERNGLSHNTFMYKYNGKTKKLKMKPNTMVIFKGSEILHKSTSIDESERRILLSMVFCDVCQEKKNIVAYVYEKIKNTIIYS